jgi:hypothetical protein
MKFVKILIVALSMLLVGMVVGVMGIKKAQYNMQMPTVSEIRDYRNNSSTLLSIDRHAVYKSRASAVKVLSFSLVRDLFSAATGTYFTMGDRYFVLTVNHGVPGTCMYTKIVVDGEFLRCKEFIELNSYDDYVIIEVDEIPARMPVEIDKDVPIGREWIKALSLMNKVYYTGYPNDTGPLTLAGEIVGYGPGGMIYLHAYAWSGSSGSGVFTSTGKLIGYVLAVEIGRSEYGANILEDVVIVAPAYNVAWNKIL